MENLAFISTILAIHIFAWFIPGPIFVLIVRNSLVYSRKTGIWTAVGVALGNCVHISLVVTGIALIMSTSPLAFNIIKFLGVAYVAYLGVKTLFLKIKTPKADVPAERKDISKLEAVKIGFLTNILSPTASLFFASIFATVFSSSAPLWVVVFLMVAMPLNSFFMASLLSVFFTQKKVGSVYSKYQGIANKCLGGALILLAVMVGTR